MKTKTIIQHEEKYWYIPKFSILPLIGLILFTLLAIGNFQLIDKSVLKEVFKHCGDNCVYDLIPNNLINLYPILGEYILISLALINLVASIKRGYKNLKPYNKDGLIVGLIVGLIFGLIGGLILGLIFGLIFGLIVGLIGGLIGGLILGLIFGLIVGLIVGLIGGLIGGLIFGLNEEFEE